MTWPSLRTLYLTSTILSMIWTLGDFNSVYLLTGGGPTTIGVNNQMFDPGDGALNRSGAQVSARAAEVGRLTARLAELSAASMRET